MAPDREYLKLRKRASRYADFPEMPSMTPSLEYTYEHYEEIQEANPGAPHHRILKIGIAQYQALSDEDREAYLVHFNQVVDEYKENVKNYVAAYKEKLEKRKAEKAARNKAAENVASSMVEGIVV